MDMWRRYTDAEQVVTNSEQAATNASDIASVEAGRIPARKVAPAMNERERALERHKAQRDEHLQIMANARRLRAMPPVQPTTVDEWREYIA